MIKIKIRITSRKVFNLLNMALIKLYFYYKVITDNPILFDVNIYDFIFS